MNLALILSLNDKANLLEQWDFGFIKDFLNGNVWRTPNWTGFDTMVCNSLPATDRAVVCIAARHHKGLEKQINNELSKIKNVVLFLLGDEEGEFDIEQIKHDSIHIWVQNANPNKHDNYFRFGTGYPQHMKMHLKELPKDIDIFFSGQVTHNRRIDMQNSLINYGREYDEVDANYTEGFTQGLDHPTYYNKMCRAKVVPCPSGAVVPDSFRLFEALECMAVPIADETSPDGTITHYWDWLFNEITPFPKITSWEFGVQIMRDSIENYDYLVLKQTAWWVQYKRKFAYKVMEQLYV